MLFSKLLKL